jgi:RNA polymerase sigma factor (sigma-70 family)
MTEPVEAAAARVRMGDAQAFADLYDAVASDIYRFLVRRCDDRDVAEDLMSVTFLEAWRCRDRAFVVEESLRPWLFGIAANVARNAARSRRRHRQALERYHASNADIAEPDVADEAARSADKEQVSRSVWAALGALSDKERDVADLCLVEGWSTATAATALHLPEGTVKSRLARAREKMQRLLRSSELTDLTVATGHVPGEQPPGAPVAGVAPHWSQP